MSTDVLEALWARIPSTNCRGLCQKSCGPIGMSNVERARIAERHGITIENGETKPGTMECPALTTDGRCSIYEDRPTVCRLWGAVEAMPCPHGCRPTLGILSDAHGAELMRAANALDGPDGVVPAETLEHILADPVAGPLMRRAMRGDRSAYPELANRIIVIGCC